jgi:hypothetical protein
MPVMYFQDSTKIKFLKYHNHKSKLSQDFHKEAWLSDQLADVNRISSSNSIAIVYI